MARPETARPTAARARGGRRGAALVAALATAAVLSACSSAPAPTGLRSGEQGAIDPLTGAPLAVGQGGAQQGAGAAAGGGAAGGAAAGGAAGSGATGTGTAGGSGGSGGAYGTGGGAAGGGSAGSGGGTGGGSSGSVPPPSSGLFPASTARTGMTATTLNMCMHAALTYGAAFHTQTSDFNVFWQYLNDRGGVGGRKVSMTYQNDNYDPQTAVTAASDCAATAGGIFALLSGIGFDQIPTVRDWAEQHKMLYLYHTATINGSAGKQYSFTGFPTVERTGQAFAQLIGWKFPNTKVGIIERDSENWSPGISGFKAMAAKEHFTIVADDKVAANAGNYSQQLLDMQNAGAQEVFIWLNALESTEVIQESKNQQFSPTFVVFPFNLTSQTLGSEAMNPPMYGVGMYPAYSYGDYSGSFAPYASEMKEFEAAYAHYDPPSNNGPDLTGVGGDLLFQTWTAFKFIAAQLQTCGRGCDRNRLISTLQHFDGTSDPANCPIDFVHSPDGHHGGTLLNFMETYNAPSGKVNWHNIKSCVGAP